jgi:hypothetical protein
MATIAGAATTAERADAERLVGAELEAWRARNLPDPSAPLDADDLARLVRSCLETLGVGDAATDFSVNTVHYYRRKDILDAPVGRTSSARYALRHVWQAVGARLAGHLGLVTLAEARDVMRDAEEPTLVAFACARIVDARARQRLKGHAPRTGLLSAPVTAPPSRLPTIVPLTGDAYCIVPPGHAALHSPSAASELVRALASALGVESR